jgi:hypothetical protein
LKTGLFCCVNPVNPAHCRTVGGDPSLDWDRERLVLDTAASAPDDAVERAATYVRKIVG